MMPLNSKYTKFLKFYDKISYKRYFILNLFFSLFDLSDIMDEASRNMNLNLKDNIDYLGNGVDMEKMIKNARSHFEVLETDFSRSNDDDAYLKV